MSDNGDVGTKRPPGSGMLVLLAISWLWVGIPLGWGVSKTVESSIPLFKIGSAAAAAK